jgi:hypothetical protein
VRLSLPQLTTAVGALLGAELTQALQDEFQIDPMQNFRALEQEGSAFTDPVFATSDGIAARAGEHVGDHFAEVTGCEATRTYDCVREFVYGLAERAYRRPLTDAERESLDQVLTDAESLEATVEEAAQFGAYAVFESPGFVYRTEFGAEDDGAETRLTPHEIASELAFFVTGGPPDQALLDAAARDALSTPDAIAPHVDRLLSSEAGRRNLETAVLARLGVQHLDTVVIEPTVYPTYGEELRNAMQLEARAFAQSTLWSGSAGDLLTSRRTRVNQSLAELYGVEFPPAGATPDAQGFADVVLPEGRSGILTQGAVLVPRARPDRGSIVLRGVFLQSLLCVETPPFPDLIEFEPPMGPLSEREQAEFRLATAPCNGCHTSIDPFGIALGQFDAIGRARSEDSMGFPIDTAVTLPVEVGGQSVANAAELGAAVAEGPFVDCLVKSFLDYALAESEADDCEVERVIKAHRASGDPSFSGLIRQVALSKALAVRGAREP